MKDADARGPGHLLLKLARALVSEPVLRSLVHPVIADLQYEVARARPGIARRLAYTRGVWACWRVLIVAPFAAAPLPQDRTILSGPAPRGSDPSLKGAPLLSSLLVVLLAATWPVVGWLTVAIPVCGLLFAIVMHWWYVRHPAGQVEAGVPTRWRAAEINFASIPVGGNVGGFLAAVGSVSVILLGVPQVRVFLAGSIVAGVVTAGVLSSWRTAHAATSSTRLLVR